METTVSGISNKMKCPKCGAEMNFHAQKITYGIGSSAGGDTETAGGTLQEFHACPKCGAVASRLVAA
jgi:ribosomal protein S27AE